MAVFLERGGGCAGIVANHRASGFRFANKNGAVTSAVLVHQHVEPPHFDWHARERPALALLAWEASLRSGAKAMLLPERVQSERRVFFRPTAATNPKHRGIVS
ncbi:MAG: hypothetical protein JOZ74_09925 [Bradyrhizobium sp.]|nr:hypothetical protein [Bradyrhizobium sp.]